MAASATVAASYEVVFPDHFLSRGRSARHRAAFICDSSANGTNAVFASCHSQSR